MRGFRRFAQLRGVNRRLPDFGLFGPGAIRRLKFAASADSKGKPVGSEVPAVAKACDRVNP
jgi:hypothetical protein